MSLSNTKCSSPAIRIEGERGEKSEVVTKPADVKKPETPVKAASEEVPPAEVNPPATEESSDAAAADEAPVEKVEEASAAAGGVEETTETSEEGNAGDAVAAEEQEIKVETAPGRFFASLPPTKQDIASLNTLSTIVVLPPREKVLPNAISLRNTTLLSVPGNG
ncbi:hypothetical protein CDL15_Pgr007019 [Punica granatum]|uniref:Uncharacterized protein n=1 Tax=Punica granatum TaxID=22663 RepID=A0A218X856_PUNGR|nr:hypothetical protein CDL15_Pgr007019 [Punica granatum]